MPNTKNQKSRARMSREAGMLSDIEDLDKMLGSNRHEKEESEFCNSVRRTKSSNYNAMVNHDGNSHSNSREARLGVMPEMARS